MCSRVSAGTVDGWKMSHGRELAKPRLRVILVCVLNGSLKKAITSSLPSPALARSESNKRSFFFNWKIICTFTHSARPSQLLVQMAGGGQTILVAIPRFTHRRAPPARGAVMQTNIGVGIMERKTEAQAHPAKPCPQTPFRGKHQEAGRGVSG